MAANLIRASNELNRNSSQLGRLLFEFFWFALRANSYNLLQTIEPISRWLDTTIDGQTHSYDDDDDADADADADMNNAIALSQNNGLTGCNNNQLLVYG